MPKTYHAIHQWNHWLTNFLGKNMLALEEKELVNLMKDHYGKNSLLLGVPHQINLLNSSIISRQFLLGPLINRDKNIHYIESEFYELPIQSGSVDQVILPHTLEFLDNPHHLLSEACRIVKPEGYIYIIGFNPYSLWGLKRYFMKNRSVPWSGNFIPASKIKKWLLLADFELEKQSMVLFRPATHHVSLYNKLKFLEWLGRKCYKPWGGVYLLKAKAKVIPLTPIRLNWKQELSGLRIPASTMRNFS